MVMGLSGPLGQGWLDLGSNSLASTAAAQQSIHTHGICVCVFWWVAWWPQCFEQYDWSHHSIQQTRHTFMVFVLCVLVEDLEGRMLHTV
jgi:hypothetical protein